MIKVDSKFKLKILVKFEVIHTYINRFLTFGSKMATAVDGSSFGTKSISHGSEYNICDLFFVFDCYYIYLL